MQSSAPRQQAGRSWQAPAKAAARARGASAVGAKEAQPGLPSSKEMAKGEPQQQRNIP